MIFAGGSNTPWTYKPNKYYDLPTTVRKFTSVLNQTVMVCWPEQYIYIYIYIYYAPARACVRVCVSLSLCVYVCVGVCVRVCVWRILSSLLLFCGYSSAHVRLNRSTKLNIEFVQKNNYYNMANFCVWAKGSSKRIILLASHKVVSLVVVWFVYFLKQCVMGWVNKSGSEWVRQKVFRGTKAYSIDWRTHLPNYKRHNRPFIRLTKTI